ncbi:hypothetical protein [Rhodoblastus sp.]|uniref:hypothetical protein n=1 Tax=Rhodoblastus sp. TaxID=1962975 RepID=UPI003F975935
MAVHLVKGRLAEADKCLTSLSGSALCNFEPPLNALDLGLDRGNGPILRNFALHESRHMAFQAAHIRFEIDKIARDVGQLGLNRLERFEQVFIRNIIGHGAFLEPDHSRKTLRAPSRLPARAPRFQGPGNEGGRHFCFAEGAMIVLRPHPLSLQGRNVTRPAKQKCHSWRAGVRRRRVVERIA